MRNFAVKLIVIIHVLWVFAVLATLPLALLYPTFHKSILWFLGFTLVAQIPLKTCPFTYMENRLRKAGGYQETFLSHYSAQLFGLNISDKQIRIMMTIFFIIVILISVFYKLHQGFGKAHPGIY